MSSRTEPLVVFDSVDKVYEGGVKVVDNLNLRVEHGEFLTLIGPSGSGKTTTLMMLAGFEAPTKGIIRFDGAPLNDVPTYKRDFGIVFQNYALFPHMTVAENLAFPLRMRRENKAVIAERVRNTLDMVKLSALSDRMPTQLSGGQQQRVALARALVFSPRMVLMDEPLGALDAEFRERMAEELRALHDRMGATTVYVTHDQLEAMQMGDKIVVMNRGVVEQWGTPQDIYDFPATMFVADFIGSSNILEATVKESQPAGSLVRTQHGLRLDVSTGGESVGAQVMVLMRPGPAVITMIRSPSVTASSTL